MSGILSTRLAASLGLLIGLALIQQTTGNAFPLLVAMLLIAIPLIQWAAVVFFARKLDQHPDIDALRARVQDGVALALASSVGALLGIATVFRALNLIPAVDRTLFLVGLSYVFLMVAAPAVNALVTWRPWEAET